MHAIPSLLAGYDKLLIYITLETVDIAVRGVPLKKQQRSSR
jgi:hypothetical protein